MQKLARARNDTSSSLELTQDVIGCVEAGREPITPFRCTRHVCLPVESSRSCGAVPEAEGGTGELASASKPRPRSTTLQHDSWN